MQAHPSFPPPFAVVVRPEENHVVVAPRGELDLATVGELEAAIERVRSDGAKTVLLDLRGLTFIDSTGLVMMLRIDAKSRADGFDFAIADKAGPVRRLLTVAQMRDHFRHGAP